MGHLEKGLRQKYFSQRNNRFITKFSLEFRNKSVYLNYSDLRIVHLVMTNLVFLSIRGLLPLCFFYRFIY